MAKLINGNGNPAIYAAEDADLIASLAGNVTCIANVGNKYAATEEDATTIRLDDGVIVTKEGRRIQLEAGESDTFYIPTGTSGVTNYYIIGYKLVQKPDSTQVAEQFVQKMNSSTATITEDTFRGGATEVYVSLYRVTQVGFNLSSITGLLPILRTLQDGGEASDVSFDNTGTDISASNVQDALEELDDEKANLSGGNWFTNEQRLKDSRIIANIPVDSYCDGYITFKDKNGAAIAGIVPYKADATSFILAILEVTDIYVNGKKVINSADVIDSLASSATDKPLSAKQGKTLKEYISQKAVTPQSSGKSTLLAYINEVVIPLGIENYTFTASDFPDLPFANWGFTIVVITSGGGAVLAYAHQSSSAFYTRTINASSTWITDWLRLNPYEVKTFDVNTDSSGLYNTGLSVNEWFIASTFIAHPSALISTAFDSGGLWYLKFTNNNFTNYHTNIEAKVVCLCYKR